MKRVLKYKKHPSRYLWKQESIIHTHCGSPIADDVGFVCFLFRFDDHHLSLGYGYANGRLLMHCLITRYDGIQAGLHCMKYTNARKLVSIIKLSDISLPPK